ncbi:MAG TPA: sulfur carrier protein ThiS [Spirochaetota bacterium]|nr:sulfur carrier protein ThiS [Spirochaetota bacterium]
MIRATVNGEKRDLPEGTSILAFILLLDIAPPRVVVEHNGAVADRKSWNETVIHDGDNLEIVNFMAGG